MNKKKVLGLVACAIVLVVGSVMGTMAWLTSQDEAVNTFTVGDVKIELDEADVKADGTLDTDERVKSNTYKLMPGHTYIKDPTVTVKRGSDECYVRMLVYVDDMSKLKAAFPVADYPSFYNGDLFLLQNLVTGWDSAAWNYVGQYDGAYEFRYYTTVTALDADVELAPLFQNIVVPDTVDNAHLKYLEAVQIKAVGHAIQKDGFADAAAAWAKW